MDGVYVCTCVRVFVRVSVCVFYVCTYVCVRVCVHARFLLDVSCVNIL